VIITDGNYSVCNWVGIYRLNYRRNIYNVKKKRFDDVEVFAGDFTDGLPKGFKPRSPYNDMTNSPSDLLTESPTEWVCRCFHRSELIYKHSADPLLPYFSIFFPIPTLPSQIANNHPLKTSPSSQHKSYFLKFCGHNIRVLIYCGFYHFL